MQNPYLAPLANVEPPAPLARAPQLFSWHGRIGRVRFMAFCLAGIALTLLYRQFASYAIVASAGLHIDVVYNAWLMKLLVAPFFLLPFLTILPAICCRLHDFGVRGWHAWLLLFPFLNIVFVIYLLVSPGEPDANGFGPAPAANSRAVLLGSALGGAALLALIVLRFL